MLHPGEIVLIPFPYTNHSATKRRLVLVLRPPDPFGDFLAVAVTSQAGHQNTVALTQADFQKGVLPKPSYVRISKLYTLNERIITHSFVRSDAGSLCEDTHRHLRCAWMSTVSSGSPDECLSARLVGYGTNGVPNPPYNDSVTT